MSEMPEPPLSLDEPFLPLNSPPPTVGTAITGPNGSQELVDLDWLEERTLVMDRAELDRLLEAERLTQLLRTQLHTRPTVRSMEAVNLPPSRPVPEVEVVDSHGRRVEP